MAEQFYISTSNELILLLQSSLAFGTLSLVLLLLIAIINFEHSY
jgi:hypothetical protein